MLKKINFSKKIVDEIGDCWFQKSSKVTFLPFYSSSWYCSINTNKTGNPSLLSLWTVSAQQAPLPVPVRNISIQDQESLSAPGPDCPCQARASSWSGGRVKHRTQTPNPGLVNPESFMETSRFTGALFKHLADFLI